MSQASFRIRPDRGIWVVVEEGGGRVGGVFATLIAALEFVDGEVRYRADPNCTMALPKRITSSPSHVEGGTVSRNITLPKTTLTTAKNAT